LMDKIVQEDLGGVLNEVELQSLSGRRMLVAGGAGFLGSWLCDALVRAGADVACLDNLSTGLLWNISHLRGLKNFELIEGSVDKPPEGVYEYVLHFASRPSPEDYQAHPVETLLANSIGTYNMLERARRGDAVFVYASTSEVYGDAQVIPTPEDYWGNVNPVGPRSCYDEGKRFSEALAMAYHRQYGLNVRIPRIFNSYGPRIRCDGAYGRSLSRFILQALRGEPITVYGDGTQTRSYTYVTDTLTATLKATVDNRVNGEALNIGNPSETRIIDLANLVKRLTGSGSPIVFKPLPRDDPRRRMPDIAKAERLLGWRPKIGPHQGLERTVKWLRRYV